MISRGSEEVGDSARVNGGVKDEGMQQCDGGSVSLSGDQRKPIGHTATIYVTKKGNAGRPKRPGVGHSGSASLLRSGMGPPHQGQRTAYDCDRNPGRSLEKKLLPENRGQIERCLEPYCIFQCVYQPSHPCYFALCCSWMNAKCIFT